MENETLMTVNELAGYLRLTRRALYNHLAKGEIPGKKIGKEWRFDREIIHRWVTRNDTVRQDTDLKILIVDDNEAILEVLSGNIEEMLPQSQIRTETDGYSALVSIGEFKPNVIILDIDIPKVDGIAVCRYLKNCPHTKHIVIIVITGFTHRDYRRQAKEAGANAYFEKPLKFHELIQIIKGKSFSF